MTGTSAAEKPPVEKDTASAEKPSPAVMPDKRRALGRGLDSLLPGGPRVVTGATNAPPTAGATHGTAIGDLQAQAARPAAGEGVVQIPLDAIDSNPFQTRRFGKDHDTPYGASPLHELAESIRSNGVIQPITVRPGKDGRYILITGERRWRASRIAEKDKVPAIVRQVSDQQAAEMTLVENVQRQDLNCVDQARAFVLLSNKFGMTQEQIGKRVGVSRESVANYMRMMRLPDDVLQYLQDGFLSFSQARALLNLIDLKQASAAAEIALKKHLTVLQLEALVFDMNVPVGKTDATPAQPARAVDPNVRAAQDTLERALGVRVKITDRKGKGRIVIEYATLEDFDRVVEMLAKN